MKYKSLDIHSIPIIGGHDHSEQQLQLTRVHHVIIATPGRLRDMLDQRMCTISQCEYIVMDECDRMCEMGFEEDLNYILNAIGGKRQTVMFSATMPDVVKNLSKK